MSLARRGRRGRLAPDRIQAVKIAVYTVAYNEVAHARRWATSCAQADFRFVADTGSTDGTVKALRNVGVTVSSISIDPWRFDDARNAALALLPVDVDLCISLDMDEVLAPGFIKAVRRAWEKAGPFERGFIEIDTGARWQVNRIHGRKGYRWVAPCHEVAVPYPMREEHAVFIEGALIKHRPDNSKPRTQYLGLLELAVSEQPSDFRMWAYLSREYGLRQDWLEVLRTGQRAMDLTTGTPNERAATCRWLAMASSKTGAQDEDVLFWVHQGTVEAPDEPGAWFAKAAWSSDLKRHVDVIEAAERGLACPPVTHYLRDDSLPWRFHHYLAVAFERLGDLDRSLEELELGAKAAEGYAVDGQLLADLSKMRAHWGRPAVSVIVPVWNAWAMTERCLDALLPTLNTDDEVVLVNDGSTDKTAGVGAICSVQWRFKDKRLKEIGWAAPNRGFAAACNAGAEAATNPTLVFLNNDVIVTEGWLNELIGHLRSETVVASGARAGCVSGPQIVEEAPEIDDLEEFSAEWLKSHQGRSRKTDRLVGFCLAVEAEMFNKVGRFRKFNDSMGGYEDDDLCRKLKAFGDLVIADGCYVHHDGHATFDANNVDWFAEQEKARVGYEKVATKSTKGGEANVQHQRGEVSRADRRAASRA